MSKEKQKVLEESARKIADFNMRIQGQFVKELFDSIFAKIDSLNRTVTKSIEQQSITQKLKEDEEMMKTQSLKSYKHRYGDINCSFEEEQEPVEPQQVSISHIKVPDIIPKSVALSKEEKLAKKQRMIAKLKGGAFKTST